MPGKSSFMKSHSGKKHNLNTPLKAYQHQRTSTLMCPPFPVILLFYKSTSCTTPMHKNYTTFTDSDITCSSMPLIQVKSRSLHYKQLKKEKNFKPFSLWHLGRQLNINIAPIVSLIYLALLSLSLAKFPMT